MSMGMEAISFAQSQLQGIYDLGFVNLLVVSSLLYP
jgi:hypothetical protein